MLPTRESIFAMFEFIHFLQYLCFFYLRHNVNFFRIQPHRLLTWFTCLEMKM